MKVLFAAAHGGFQGEHVPLGGGAAVFEMLCAAWQDGTAFALHRLTPSSLQLGASGRDIIGFDTGSYARFCRKFEEATTAAILRHDPADCTVLVNDIAEGPNFSKLREAGYRTVTIWHVDVVNYIASIYCRELVSPQTLVRLHSALEPLLPDVLQLIFRKQRDCVLNSTVHIVPSPLMKEIILRCYPEANPASIHVLPWGAPPVDGNPPDRQEARRAFGLPENALVFLTLSRLSPEKNQQLLLDALLEWEQREDFPSCPVYALICGGAAFMQGKKHETMLRAKAARLRRARVLFPGFVHGDRKQAAFAAADLYVFPSSHESYGLTLMEASRAGLPALTLDHAGARSVMSAAPPGQAFGAMATSRTFAAALRRLASDTAALREYGRAAKAYAEAYPFELAAHRVAEILTDR